MSIEALKNGICSITEPRRASHGNIRHRLEDIIIIALCAIICSGEDFTDIEVFGKERKEWLKGFLGLPNGIPDSDIFCRLFERLNPAELSNYLSNWLEVERNERSAVAVDGKTIRGSGSDEREAYHVVSAFISKNQITLGEIAAAEKSNEITAIPELLDLADIHGGIVAIDSMGCQKAIAEKIKSKNADYVLAPKDNQRKLHEDVRLHFEAFGSEMNWKRVWIKDMDE